MLLYHYYRFNIQAKLKDSKDRHFNKDWSTRITMCKYTLSDRLALGGVSLVPDKAMPQVSNFYAELKIISILLLVHSCIELLKDCRLVVLPFFKFG
jgi:hypothetical protein